MNKKGNDEKMMTKEELLDFENENFVLRSFLEEEDWNCYTYYFYKEEKRYILSLSFGIAEKHSWISIDVTEIYGKKEDRIKWQISFEKAWNDLLTESQKRNILAFYSNCRTKFENKIKRTKDKIKYIVGEYKINECENTLFLKEKMTKF